MAIVINGSGTVTGLTAQASDVELTDSTKIMLGTSDDLQIWHDAGGNSYVYESGSGSLVIKATDLYLNSTADEAMASFIENGAASLMYDTATKLATTSTGVTVTGSVDGADNLVEEVASGSTAALSHDGTASDAIYTITDTHSTYLVTASANSSITNAIALVSIGTSTSTMRITNMGENYNSSITGSGSNIQVTCSYGSSLTYQYRVIQLR